MTLLLTSPQLVSVCHWKWMKRVPGTRKMLSDFTLFGALPEIRQGCQSVTLFPHSYSESVNQRSGRIQTSGPRLYETFPFIDICLMSHLPVLSPLCRLKSCIILAFSSFYNLFVSNVDFWSPSACFFRSILQSTMNVRWFKSNFTFTSLYLIY